jgi:hypothetical protein
MSTIPQNHEVIASNAHRTLATAAFSNPLQSNLAAKRFRKKTA